MGKVSTQISFDNVKAKYGKIDCFFTYYDGEKSTFDFYGTNENGDEVRFSLGGCPAWIKHLSFGSKDGLNIFDALERHVRYISVTDNHGRVIYENFFE